MSKTYIVVRLDAVETRIYTETSPVDLVAIDETWRKNVRANCRLLADMRNCEAQLRDHDDQVLADFHPSLPTE